LAATTRQKAPKNEAQMAAVFVAGLLQWNAAFNTRQMPWKGEKDAYKIWLSEIILQQTRVEQGWEYYLRFVAKYPTIQQLANAHPDEVYKLWEGLGYYSRCRNMLAAAQQVMNHHQGIFPNTYAQILQLKGVGPYTAAAISSFAFQLPHAVVDGNVVRILARFFGINLPYDTAEGKKRFALLAQQLLPAASPATYNQAIMDFGATVCKPAAPLCEQCILAKHCKALALHQVHSLPVKRKQLPVKTRWFCYLMIEGPLGMLVEQRSSKDIWQQLYQFPLHESEEAFDWDKRQWEHFLTQWGLNVEVHDMATAAAHKLTHQTINAIFVLAHTRSKNLIQGFEWANKERMDSLAFPRLIRSFLDQRAG
jgi:A/G-specific adenine glycosylase